MKKQQQQVRSEDIFNAILLGARNFLSGISRSHANGRLYGFLFEVSCEGFDVHAAAATEEGLAEFAEKNISDGQSVAKAIAEYRWGSTEDAWYQASDGEFNEANRLLSIAASQGDKRFSGKGIEQVCLKVLKELDEQHIFGEGADREKVVLGLCHIGGDNSEKDFLRWAKQVNSPSVMKRLRSELHAASYKSDEGTKALANGILNCDSIRLAYQENFEEANKRLLKIGEKAIPALLKTLDDDEAGWFAAFILAKIGASSPEVIRALRRRASKKHVWCARALGILGDIDWLCRKPSEIAIEGLAFGFSSMSKQPLNYLPLEKYLASAKTSLRKSLEEHMRSAAKTLTVSDVDEAIRGLKSRYALVRRHAVSTLGNRKLGKKAALRILPEVAQLLSDKDSNVVVRAISCIDEWGAAGKPYHGSIRNLISHPDEHVRNIARSVLRVPRNV